MITLELDREIQEAKVAVKIAEDLYRLAAPLYEEAAWFQLKATLSRLNALLAEARGIVHRPHTH